MKLKRFLALGMAMSLSLALAACSGDTSSTSETTDTASSDSASEELTEVIEDSVFGPSANFDYLNFTLDKGLTEAGLWDGIKATDYVTLPEDFATVTVPTADITPTEESIDTEITNILEAYKTVNQVTDRAAVDGDTVIIDYVGSVDGVEFTGGTAEGATLVLGSGQFIPGFEEQIVGKTPGETFDITVTFPEGYSDSSDADGNVIPLSGAEAVFGITFQYINEEVVPELTDEWVSATFGEELEITTVDALREDITATFFEQNKDYFIMNYLFENSTFGELPESMIDYQVNQLLSYYASQAAMYGLDLETFTTTIVQISGLDELITVQEEAITYYVKQDLIVQAIAEQLEITVTEEKMELYAEYVEQYPVNYVTYNALYDTVIETIRNVAIVV